VGRAVGGASPSIFPIDRTIADRNQESALHYTTKNKTKQKQLGHYYGHLYKNGQNSNVFTFIVSASVFKFKKESAKSSFTW
jgi:hypothetical protein